MKITDEAVEAVALALVDYDERVARGTEPGYTRAARTILEAAIPYLDSNG